MHNNHAVSNIAIVNTVPYKNVGRESFRNFHKLLALIVICWLNNGIFTYALPYVPNFIRWGLFIAWFGAAIITNKKFVNTFVNQCWPLLCFFVYILTISFFIDVDYMGTYIKTTSYLIMVYSIFLYYFNDKYLKFSKIIVTVLFVDCLFLAINTYFQLERNPLIARYLSTSSESIRTLLGTSDINGVGSYGYFYALVSIILLMFFLLLSYRKRKLLALVFMYVFLMVLIKSSFTIAILMTFSFILLLVIFKYVNRFTLVCVLLLGTLMFFTMRGELGPLFRSMAEINGISPEVSTRFYELAYFFSGNNILGSDLSSRNSLYQMSIEAFLNNPIFGISLSKITSYTQGGHSSWLDLLANFGLFSAPLFVFLYKAYKYCKSRVSENFKVFVTGYWLYFICLGFINTLLFSNIYTIWLLFLPLTINTFFKPGLQRSTTMEAAKNSMVAHKYRLDF